MTTFYRPDGAAVHIFVSEASDVDWARQSARDMATREGLTEKKAVALATAVSEIGRNIVAHAVKGQIALQPVTDGERRGILAVARDQGPGIVDIARAMQDGYSTKHTLGSGLPGAKRLVDEFEIESVVGVGVTITMLQWDEDDLSDL
jgi:serine/threonine-protein kinase RsbT